MNTWLKINNDPKHRCHSSIVTMWNWVIERSESATSTKRETEKHDKRKGWRRIIKHNTIVQSYKYTIMKIISNYENNILFLKIDSLNPLHRYCSSDPNATPIDRHTHTQIEIQKAQGEETEHQTSLYIKRTAWGAYHQ